MVNGAESSNRKVVWNIPATATSLPEGAPKGPQLPNGAYQISATGQVYRGPGAAATGPQHHYMFELYALDVNINVQAAGQQTLPTRDAVWDAMKTHIRGKAVLVGLYRRPAP